MAVDRSYDSRNFIKNTLMNDTSTFENGFWKSFGWFLLIAILICCLPWLLAKNYWLIDFSRTGQIGDTIGGIMGPFIAIAAAGLTFIANTKPIFSRDMTLPLNVSRVIFSR